MKRIPLSQGKFAVVDDEDFDWLNQWKWFAAGRYISKNGRITFYAARNVPIGNAKQRLVLMHRQIMLFPRRPTEIDHVNHNGLDNQKTNLRYCTQVGNQQNRMSTKGTSQYKGVHLHRKRWRATIWVNKKRIHLGIYDTEIEAARAYDVAALEHFGEFACLNFSIKKAEASP